MNKLLLTLLPLVLTGCLNIEYTGKKFTPQEYVRYVTAPDAVPLDDYILIGKFTVSPTHSPHPYVVEEAVLEKSREYGGDILLFNSTQVLPRHSYNNDAEEFGAPDPAERKVSEEEKKHFGKAAPLTSLPSRTRKKQIYRFSLYKNKAEVKRQLGY